MKKRQIQKVVLVKMKLKLMVVLVKMKPIKRFQEKALKFHLMLD